jgi:hypothetical protein
MFPTLTVHVNIVELIIGLAALRAVFLATYRHALAHPHGRIDRFWCRVVMRPLLGWVLREDRKRRP